MAQYKLAFLGTGNMGGALVAAAANGGHGAACILSNRTPQKALAPGQAPKATFVLAPGETGKTVYAYCNLHGLWEAKL